MNYMCSSLSTLPTPALSSPMLYFSLLIHDVRGSIHSYSQYGKSLGSTSLKLPTSSMRLRQCRLPQLFCSFPQEYIGLVDGVVSLFASPCESSESGLLDVPDEC